MGHDAETARPRPFALFMLPPPLLFGIAFGVGALIHYWSPIPSGLHSAALFYGGCALLGVGLCLGIILAASFLVQRTTLNPFATPSTFVERGPYRFSRNPMYLAIILAYLGGTMMVGSIWPLATLIAPVAILSGIVIPFEEASMSARFGETYREYCARVRRWI